jgi:hypothetical protein
MSVDLDNLGRFLLFIGVIFALLGVVLIALPKIPFVGRLPGDFIVERGRFLFYFPIASCLLASMLLSLVVWLFNRLH